MSKMINCKSCNAEIAASAKTCPHCGAKNKKPVYKRPWFIVLIVLILVGVFAGGGSDESAGSGSGSGDAQATQQEEQKIEYKAYDVDTLIDDLESNAMKAAETYDDQYVKLTGELEVIDSSGSYISIYPMYEDFVLTSVQCYIQNDEQRQKIMDMSIGDIVVVKGKITDVGEVMGYSLDIDSVKVK